MDGAAEHDRELTGGVGAHLLTKVTAKPDARIVLGIPPAVGARIAAVLDVLGDDHARAVLRLVEHVDQVEGAALRPGRRQVAAAGLTQDVL